MLREDQVQRYARQILLREVGGRGQLRLLAARVRVHGEGRAAEEAATYLAAAGVGALVLDAALAARIGPRLAALNADAALMRPGDAEPSHECTPSPPDDRLAGAMAAHAVLADASGAIPGFTWRPEPGVLPGPPSR